VGSQISCHVPCTSACEQQQVRWDKHLYFSDMLVLKWQGYRNQLPKKMAKTQSKQIPYISHLDPRPLQNASPQLTAFCTQTNSDQTQAVLRPDSDCTQTKLRLHSCSTHLHDDLALVDPLTRLRVGHDVPGGAAAGVAIVPQGSEGGQHLRGRQVQPLLDTLQHSIAT
jgi:hypothetical protein